MTCTPVFYLGKKASVSHGKQSLMLFYFKSASGYAAGRQDSVLRSHRQRILAGQASHYVDRSKHSHNCVIAGHIRTVARLLRRASVLFPPVQAIANYPPLPPHSWKMANSAMCYAVGAFCRSRMSLIRLLPEGTQENDICKICVEIRVDKQRIQATKAAKRNEVLSWNN